MRVQRMCRRLVLLLLAAACLCQMALAVDPAFRYGSKNVSWVEMDGDDFLLLDGDEAFARVRGYLCDAAAIGACYREHVGPPSKPLKSQIRDLQRALGRAEVPGVPDGLARLLAEEKEEGADEGARKVKEDWGDVDEEAW